MSAPALLSSVSAPVLAGLDPPYWAETLIKVGVVAVLVPTTALILGIVFLFKVMSWMQSRVGPQEAGPRGLLQLLADGVKFIQKQDIIPDAADRFVFKVAPMVVLIGTFLLYVIIPASPNVVVESLDTGVFFALAVSSLSTIGVLMAGWGSANKYALMSGIRAAGQLIAYELPMVLAVVGVVIQAGTLNLNGIVAAQADFKLFGVSFPFYILTQLPMFLVFLAAAQAELTQPPFDMPVAESELVGGYQVEYSGFRFLFFFMGEFATAFAFAALASVLFLGGWSIPFVGSDSEIYTSAAYWLIGPIVLFTKIMLVSFLIFWFRFTYPRFREDQLQKVCWKYLIPLSLIWLGVTAVGKVCGLAKKAPITYWTFWIGTLALAGIFPFAGFFSKDEILTSAFNNIETSGLYWVFFIGLEIAAFMTAFYMGRACFLTFSGAPRSPKAEHAHESPRLMTTPLIVLAGFALLLGWLGSPWIGGNLFGTFLQPAAEAHGAAAAHGGEHHGFNWTVAGISTLMALLGLGLSWLIYRVGLVPVNWLKYPAYPLYYAAKHKFWFDDLYEGVIVRLVLLITVLLRWIDTNVVDGAVNLVGWGVRVMVAMVCAFIDKWIIDGAVNLIGWVTKEAGDLGSRAQTGRVQEYISGLVFIACAVAAAMYLVILAWPAVQPLVAPYFSGLFGG